LDKDVSLRDSVAIESYATLGRGPAMPYHPTAQPSLRGSDPPIRVPVS
jgi:hypothetical protein